MPVAIDTSVLIAAERLGRLQEILPAEEDGPFYIPALAAAEFLVGTHPPVRAALRARARALYQTTYRDLVEPFTEADAEQLAALSSELRRKGQTMRFFDAAIAAGVLARGDKLLTADGDFDRLADRVSLLRV
jgi:predicted nucleic acid-binding protein